MTIQRTIGSASRKLLSGSVLRLGNLVTAALVALLLMPFLVRHLGDRLYGFWSLAAAFIGYYSLLDFGLSSAVSQYICIAIGRGDPAECRKVFNIALRVQSLLGVFALLATGLIAAATPWLCRNPADAALFWRVIVVLGVNAALGFPTRVYQGVLDAEFRFDIQSWLVLLGLILRTALVVCAILAGGGLLALAWMTLFATLPIMALQIFFAKRVAPWARIDSSKIERKRTVALFSYSVYTFLTSIGDSLRSQIDPIVISGFVGLAAVTHYRVASVFIAYYVNAMISSLGTFQPVMSRLHGAGDQAGMEKVFFFATKVSICASVFVGFGLIFWGKAFIGRWMGRSYEDAYWPMVVLSLSALLDVCQSPSIMLLYATFKHRFYMYVNLSEGIINIIVSIVLARSLGILGVALGTLIAAFLIRVVAQPLFVCKASGLHYGAYMRFLSWNLLRCCALIGAAVGLSAWGLRPTYPRLIGSALCATAIYSIGCWLFVFTAREREHLLAATINRHQEAIDPVTAVATP
jgi:O-antigen/teichoic acid export membrane protein